MDLTRPFTDALKAAGVRNLSNLAFTVGQPGQPLADNVVTNFLQTALGRAPSLQEVSSIKRLAFEAQTLLVATLRQQVEQKEDGEPRKIGFAGKIDSHGSLAKGFERRCHRG